MDLSNVRALAFDVFGTVVDYRGSIVREGEAINRNKRLSIDWHRFALSWRSKYGPVMARVMQGDLPWSNLDVLHRITLEDTLAEFGVDAFSEEEKQHLNLVWHRLSPWPDAVEGLTRLKRRFVIATLSNGNVALLTNMAKYGGLPWDCVLSAELFHAYKPDPRVYLGAAELLGVQPEQVMMVAAHERDLDAARAQGLRTGFVYRPDETGGETEIRMAPVGIYDVVASDFIELANALGA